MRRTDRTRIGTIALATGLVSSMAVVVAGTPVDARVEAIERRCFSVVGSPGDAAVVNLTPVRASGGGFGQLVSSEVPVGEPGSSNVNFGVGTVDPNVAVARIGADGLVCFQNSSLSSVDLVADHLGTVDGSVFTAASPDGALVRRVDTRFDPDVVHPECLEPVSAQYVTATARTMFGIASRAYEIEPGAKTGKPLSESGDTTDVDFSTQMSCWELVATIQARGVASLGPITDTQLIVARNTSSNDLVVAFRGTEMNLLDILTDADATRQSWTLPDGRTVPDAVHRGFAEAYRAARPTLLSVLTDIERAGAPEARVFFTGHSLGGALATLASIDLVDDLMALGYGREDVVTYTFGAPRSMSRTMAGHHLAFVPRSFAVANQMDPVPQVPSAVGDDHYSHIPSMVALTADLSDPRVRVDQGDGRNHRACPNSTPLSVSEALANFLLYHARTEYARRLESTTFVGAPSVRITISGAVSATPGRIQLNWSTPVEGPCDEVVLYRTSGVPTSASTPITDRYAASDGNDVHSTTVIKGDDYWVGYRNIFGELIAKREYVPSVPTVSLQRSSTGLYIDLVWKVSDPGARDLVVLFDRDPRVAGPNGWYVSPVGRVESDPLYESSPSGKLTFVGSDPNKWWVAYIMEDGNGNQRILATSRGVRG